MSHEHRPAPRPGTGSATDPGAGSGSDPARGFVGAVTGRRTAWLFALLPLVLAVLALGLAGEGERERLTTDQLPAGLDSTEGAALRDRFPEAESKVAIALFTADRGELPGAALAELERLAA